MLGGEDAGSALPRSPGSSRPVKMVRPSPIELTKPVISLDELQGDPPYGLRLSLDPAWIREVLAETDAEVSSNFTLQLELSEQGAGQYLVRGELSGKLTVPCARCLDDSAVDASAPLCVSFVPELQYRQELADMGDVQGDHLTLAESDRQPYRGKEIDLRPLLSEQILVAYPMRVLCHRQEACAGLCSQCGVNLNHFAEGKLPPCDCSKFTQIEEKEPSPQQAAWERALRQFGEKKKD